APARPVSRSLYMHRVLLVGLGPLGKMMALDAARRGIAQVVAAVDIEPGLAGKTLAHVVPECGFTTKVSGSIGEVSNWSEIDAAVVCTSSDLTRCAQTFRDLARHRLPIVS